MGGGPIIIIDPMKKFRLIENWREGWKFYTTWAYGVLIALPDLYNLAAPLLSADGMPDAAAWSLRAAALLGLVVRFIDQKKPAE